MLYTSCTSVTLSTCSYLCLWDIARLRSHGVTAEIVFTVVNGEEFSEMSWHSTGTKSGMVYN
jgi:hypothetical protein